MKYIQWIPIIGLLIIDASESKWYYDLYQLVFLLLIQGLCIGVMSFAFWTLWIIIDCGFVFLIIIKLNSKWQQKK